MSKKFKQILYIRFYQNRDEDRDKASDNLKSSSSEESVRKRRPNTSHPKNTQLCIFPQTSHYSEIDNSATALEKAQASPKIQSGEKALPAIVTPINQSQQQQEQPKSIEKSEDTIDNQIKKTINNSQSDKEAVHTDNDFHYESLDQAVKAKYAYHDEPHSFENSMDFLEDYNHYQFEVLETTV